MFFLTSYSQISNFFVIVTHLLVVSNVQLYKLFQADVIVNSTSNGLDLKNGAVSSSILRAAGPGLQDECKQKYPKGIETTEIAFTTSHNLNCKGVLHLALCNYNNSNAEQVGALCSFSGQITQWWNKYLSILKIDLISCKDLNSYFIQTVPNCACVNGSSTTLAHLSSLYKITLNT